jgi:hypothetical protein
MKSLLRALTSIITMQTASAYHSVRTFHAEPFWCSPTDSGTPSLDGPSPGNASLICSIPGIPAPGSGSNVADVPSRRTTRRLSFYNTWACRLVDGHLPGLVPSSDLDAFSTKYQAASSEETFHHARPFHPSCSRINMRLEFVIAPKRMRISDPPSSSSTLKR